jgi:hypothetical protein
MEADMEDTEAVGMEADGAAMPAELAVEGIGLRGFSSSLSWLTSC